MQLKEITLKNIYHYIIGNIRLYKFKKLLKNSKIDFSKYKNDFNWEGINDNIHVDYIQEQFLNRIYDVSIKSLQCLTNKECKYCGCTTPQLFFANKVCEGNCFTEFLGKAEWEDYKRTNNINMKDIFEAVKEYLN